MLDHRRRGLLSWLTGLTIWWHGRKQDPHDAEARRRRLSYDTDTSRLGLRMTSFLRDRLRPRWLRLRK